MKHLYLVLALLIFLPYGAVKPAAGNQRTITRISVASDGIEGNDYSFQPSISADGRYVAFESLASNLVPEDTNNVKDVFVHDRQTHETIRISVATKGTQGNGESGYPSISADGRFVAFESAASNLIDGDTNGKVDFFIHDRQTRETNRVSHDSDGISRVDYLYQPSISADGRYVAFPSPIFNPFHQTDMFIRDRQTDEITHVPPDFNGTQKIGWSIQPSMSADGRYVVFSGLAATNPGRDGGSNWFIFIYDRQAHVTTPILPIPIPPDGIRRGNASDNHGDYPKISADGRYVAFRSVASNLVPADTNNASDVFVHDLLTHETTRVSISSDGTQLNGDSLPYSISADGRYIAFDLYNVPPHTSQAFFHDRQTGQTILVPTTPDGETNHWSAEPSINADGKVIAFDARDSLVPEDTNSVTDVFVVEWTPPGSTQSPPPPAQTHLECRNNTCVSVEGAGADDCRACVTLHSFACAETGDQGDNPTVAGRVLLYRDQDPPIPQDDLCFRDEYLIEFWCNNNTGQIDWRWYQCKFCHNGMCDPAYGEARAIPGSEGAGI